MPETQYINSVGRPLKYHFSDIGPFFAAIKIENFRPVDRSTAEMDEYI